MTVIGAVASWARTQPQRAAVTDGTVTLTYAELWNRSYLAAARLAGLGARPGRPVAVIARNSIDLIVAYLGSLRLGAVFAPLNYRLGVAEIAALLDMLEPELVLVDSGLPAPTRECVAISLINDPGSGRNAVSCDRMTLQDPACVLFTSGTSGLPKGATLSHQSILVGSSVVLTQAGLSARDVVYVLLPMYHTAGLSLQTTAALLSGAKLVLAAGRWDPAEALATMSAHGTTSAFLLPEQWDELCRVATSQLPLRLPLTGGGPVSVELCEAMVETVGSPPGFGMGMTEIGPLLCYTPPTEVPGLAGAIGRPGYWYDWCVESPTGSGQAAGQEGELCVRGPALMSSYWNNVGETDDVFDSSGYLHGGDVVRIEPNGNLRIVDRKKDIIRSGGETIYSREIEDVIRKHPGIADVAVIGTPDPRWGECVTAVVVPAAGGAPSLASLQEFCAKTLARYKRPRRLKAVTSLPVNATGKVLKRDLRDLMASDEEAP